MAPSLQHRQESPGITSTFLVCPRAPSAHQANRRLFSRAGGGEAACARAPSLPHPSREIGQPDRRSSPWCWLRSPSLKGAFAPTPCPTSGGALLGLTAPGSAPVSLGWWRTGQARFGESLPCRADSPLRGKTSGAPGVASGPLLSQNSPPRLPQPETAAILRLGLLRAPPPDSAWLPPA